MTEINFPSAPDVVQNGSPRTKASMIALLILTRAVKSFQSFQPHQLMVLNPTVAECSLSLLTAEISDRQHVVILETPDNSKPEKKIAIATFVALPGGMGFIPEGDEGYTPSESAKMVIEEIESMVNQAIELTQQMKASEAA